MQVSEFVSGAPNMTHDAVDGVCVCEYSWRDKASESDRLIQTGRETETNRPTDRETERQRDRGTETERQKD